MPQPYLKPLVEIDINRSVYGGFRDDNFTSGWMLISGSSFTTNGDIGNLRSSGAFGVGKAQKTVSGSLSSTTWPYIVWRARATTDNPIVRSTSQTRQRLRTLTRSRITVHETWRFPQTRR